MCLIIEAVIANDLILLKQLLIEGANPNYTEDYLKVTPLHYAASYDLYEVALLLLTAGAKNTQEKLFRQTPLEIAYIKNDRLFKLLARVSFSASTEIH